MINVAEGKKEEVRKAEGQAKQKKVTQWNPSGVGRERMDARPPSYAVE